MIRTVLLLTLGLAGFTMGQAPAPDSTNGWGYGYDSLLSDLGKWRKSPFVKVDSIGASVQGRAIWMVSITDSGDSLGPIDDASSKKRRVFIHCRTHPAEVQAQYIASEMIRFLTDSTAKAEEMRRGFIFNIIPMYNPDGVELGYPRKNAHGIDIESNWNAQVLEPEVMVLKSRFEAYMAGPIPIEVALNLHSDQFNCTRFFFFHYAAGTSHAYEDLERKFIGGVQSHFPDGIENWDFVRSWGSGTAKQYPESFWWLNHQEKVLALTYEDTNCPNANRFDSTGRALVLGSADYIRDRIYVALKRVVKGESRVLLLPEGVRLAAGAHGSRWDLLDIRGRRLAGGPFGPGEAMLAWRDLPKAPVRILAVSRPKSPVERISLPNLPD
jgi:hypothetical protein